MLWDIICGSLRIPLRRWILKIVTFSRSIENGAAAAIFTLPLALIAAPVLPALVGVFVFIGDWVIRHRRGQTPDVSVDLNPIRALKNLVKGIIADGRAKREADTHSSLRQLAAYGIGPIKENAQKQLDELGLK